MARSGLGNGPRPVVEEFERIKTNEVILPTSAGREIRSRCATTPDESQPILLGRLGEPKWRNPNSNYRQDF